MLAALWMPMPRLLTVLPGCQQPRGAAGGGRPGRRHDEVPMSPYSALDSDDDNDGGEDVGRQEEERDDDSDRSTDDDEDSHPAPRRPHELRREMRRRRSPEGRQREPAAGRRTNRSRRSGGGGGRCAMAPCSTLWGLCIGIVHCGAVEGPEQTQA